jgi:putative toxin-antitoxin system antitoxin component (TIGR02293 family)
MKKAKPKKIISKEDEHLLVMNEPMAVYETTGLKVVPNVAEFTFKRFQKVADKVPFTQKEWANILHLSERTLQRYAKANTSFEGIYVDRILHVDEMIDLALQTFINGDALYKWLKKDKLVLGKVLNFESLYTQQGITDVTNQIGRILYGVYT